MPEQRQPRRAERAAIARALVNGDLSVEEYFARLDPERRLAGDLRLLAALAVPRDVPRHVYHRDRPKPVLLSDRELDVVECAAEGLTSKETASKLGVAFETVRSARKRALRKLGAKTIAEAVGRL